MSRDLESEGAAADHVVAVADLPLVQPSTAEAELPGRRRFRPWSPFNRLWYSAIGSNFADGVIYTAVPLLAARLTSDPFQISLVSSASMLPWLLFAVVAGSIVDRVDRRKAMAWANIGRVLAVSALAALVVTGHVSIPVLIACVFLFGVAETISDSAVVAAMPTLVDGESLDSANSKIQGAQVAVQGFIAGPVGAYLFGMAAAIPFVAGASGYGIAVAFILALPPLAVKVSRARRAQKAGSASSEDLSGAQTEELAEMGWAGVKSALRFVVKHDRLAKLWYLSVTVSFAASFAQGAFVLFVLDTLGVNESLFGVFMMTNALGGIIGVVCVTSVSKRWGRGTVMLIATIGESVAFLMMGFSVGPWLAAGALLMLSCLIGAWNVLSMSARQTLIPNAMLGRVHGVWRTAMWGVGPLGGILGGWVSRANMRAPYIIGAVVILAVGIWGARILLSFNQKLEQADAVMAVD